MTVNHEEQQYLDLLSNLMENGNSRIDRTGVGTKSIFGTSLRFDLSDGSVPIMTTKKVLWEAALIELLWFLSGETNIKPLIEKGVHIWTDWPLAKYRKASGLDIDRKAFESRILQDQDFANKWGDLGPVYGYQWRKWPKRDGGSIDQIANCIELLKTDPFSRRILFHAWNVEDVPDMAIPPCHNIYQFGVSKTQGKLRLNLSMTQRSCDIFLGAPFNYFSASALLRMVALMVDMEPGDLHWSGVDTHIYLNHIDAATTQMGRTPRPFPKLMIKRKPDSIDDFRFEDFEVVGYSPDPFIKAPVAI